MICFIVATIIGDFGNVLPLDLAVMLPIPLGFLTVYLDCCQSCVGSGTNCLDIAGLSAAGLDTVGLRGIFYRGINGILPCGEASLLVFLFSLTSLFLFSLNFLGNF